MFPFTKQEYLKSSSLLSLKNSIFEFGSIIIGLVLYAASYITPNWYIASRLLGFMAIALTSLKVAQICKLLINREAGNIGFIVTASVPAFILLSLSTFGVALIFTIYLTISFWQEVINYNLNKNQTGEQKDLKLNKLIVLVSLMYLLGGSLLVLVIHLAYLLNLGFSSGKLKQLKNKINKKDILTIALLFITLILVVMQIIISSNSIQQILFNLDPSKNLSLNILKENAKQIYLQIMTNSGLSGIFKLNILNYLAILTIIFTIKNIKNNKKRIIFLLPLVISGILAIFDTSFIYFTEYSLMIYLSIGLSRYIARWNKLFPKNPIARLFGLTIFIFTIGMIVIANFINLNYLQKSSRVSFYKTNYVEKEVLFQIRNAKEERSCLIFTKDNTLKAAAILELRGSNLYSNNCNGNLEVKLDPYTNDNAGSSDLIIVDSSSLGSSVVNNLIPLTSAENNPVPSYFKIVK
jgi:hypothetical protein